MKRINLEKELIEEIEKDLDGWAEFTTNNDSEKVMHHKNKIRQKISIKKVYQINITGGRL